MFILRQRGWLVGWAAGRRRDCKKKCKQRKRRFPLPADPAGSARATSRSGRARLSTFACRRDRGGCGDGQSEFRSLRGRCRRSGDKKSWTGGGAGERCAGRGRGGTQIFRGSTCTPSVSSCAQTKCLTNTAAIFASSARNSSPEAAAVLGGSSSQRTHSLRVNPLWLSSILLLKKQNVVGLIASSNVLACARVCFRYLNF